MGKLKEKVVTMHICSEHFLLPTARYCPSPNQDARPENTEIDLLVIHCISLPPGDVGTQAIDALFLNQLDPTAHPYYPHIAHLKVSSHVLIHRQGALTQYVPFNQRAWHAGESYYAGRTQCNDFSIGIELAGPENQFFTAAQYHTLVEVTCAIMQQFPAISPAKIVGHNEIAPGRKTDPGTNFDWVGYHNKIASKLKKNC
jgi:AmpD protein